MDRESDPELRHPEGEQRVAEGSCYRGGSDVSGPGPGHRPPHGAALPVRRDAPDPRHSHRLRLGASSGEGGPRKFKQSGQHNCLH